MSNSFAIPACARNIFSLQLASGTIGFSEHALELVCELSERCLLEDGDGRIRSELGVSEEVFHSRAITCSRASTNALPLRIAGSSCMFSKAGHERTKEVIPELENKLLGRLWGIPW